MKKVLLILCLAAMPALLFASITVGGKVTDKNNQPLIGVTVAEKGSTNGTYTDANGNFSINVKNNEAVLVFTYVGFAPFEMKVGAQTMLNVTMQDATTELTGIEVLGSRSLNRSITNSAVPIDYIDLKKVANDQGQLDVNQLLTYLAPSFNANRQSGSDAADHIDPASLRGLGPDQTLVLINGKRLHQTSLINIYGTRGRGNTGTDLDAIPVSAIDHIEILRDGASAQYGSDAIAGVINIVLKSNTGEFSGNVNGGANVAKYRSDNKSFDGANLELNGNYGMKISDKGFVNFSLDYLTRDHTNRANEPFFAADNDARTNFGEAAEDNFGSFFNSEIPISPTAQFYMFGGFNYRFSNGFQYNRSADDPRNVLSIYPNGFAPTLESVITDKTATAGVRGQLSNWNVDFSNTIGMNKFHYYSKNSVNASLGSASPTFFDDGGHQFLQNTTNLDFTRYYKSTLQGLNIAFGVENRLENYQIFAGQEESWQTYGPVIFSIDTTLDSLGNVSSVDTTFRPGGAQGFPGYRPTNVVNANRSSQAAYVDMEVNFTKQFMIDVARRAEHYTDFGNTINGKFATRFAVNDKFALRGSVSTGFRAPSLAQIYYNDTYTNVQKGQIFDAVIASNVSPVTRALGIPSLKQENAVTGSVGFTTNPFKGFSATVDGYYVHVEHRIVLTGYFTADDPVIGQYLQSANVAQAQFFTNAVNTHSIGLDAILNWATYFGDSRLLVSYIANFNKLTIDSIYTNQLLAGKQDEYFGLHEQGFLINSAPPSKMTLLVTYGMKKFTATVNVNRWGKIDLYDYDPKPYSYDAKFTVDLNLGFNFSKNASLNIGAVNLTNAYPTPYDPYETESGGAWDAVQMGFDGTFLFGKLGFKF